MTLPDYTQPLREISNLTYMIQAYRNMLGPTALKVVEMWEKNNVKRVHFDWSAEAMKKTGEERAQHILDFYEALEKHSREVKDFD